MEKLNDTFFYNLEKSVKTYRQYFQNQLKVHGFDITLDQWLILNTIIENQDIKNQLVAASWGQQIVADASHLIVFANILDFGSEQMNNYFKNVTQTRNVPMEALQGYSDFMQSSINALPLEKRNSWTAKQTYLAMNNLLNACAELKIDATPMEGFIPEKYNEILGLNALGLNAVLAVPIGYRHDDDATQHYLKVRKPAQDLFITI